MHDRPWLVVVGATLAYDAWLIKSGRASLTCHARRRPMALAVGAGYLLAHLFGVLPERSDAFSYVIRERAKGLGESSSLNSMGKGAQV